MLDRVSLLLVIIGWVFFFSPTLGSAFAWLGKMFGIGAAGFFDATAKYYFSGSWLILLLGILAAGPRGAQIGNRIVARGGKSAVTLSVVWYAVLFLLCIAGMMSSTYTSFLYFQF